MAPQKKQCNGNRKNTSSKTQSNAGIQHLVCIVHWYLTAGLLQVWQKNIFSHYLALLYLHSITMIFNYIDNIAIQTI
jgi:hypothetical protein